MLNEIYAPVTHTENRLTEVFLLKSLLALTRPDGEVVVGNPPFNPSRDDLELLGEWLLTLRVEKQLVQLARGARAAPGAISVQCEPSGVNLFLHIRRQD